MKLLLNGILVNLLVKFILSKYFFNFAILTLGITYNLKMTAQFEF